MGSVYNSVCGEGVLRGEAAAAAARVVDHDTPTT